MQVTDMTAPLMRQFMREAYSEIEPEWTKDSFNGDTGAMCCDCGAWMALVRPGKHQCDNPLCPADEPTGAAI